LIQSLALSNISWVRSEPAIFSAIDFNDACDGSYFTTKGAEDAKELVFLFFAERPKNKESILFLQISGHTWYDFT